MKNKSSILLLLIFSALLFAQSNNVDYGRSYIVMTYNPQTIHVGDTVTVRAQSPSDQNISGLTMLVVSTKSGSQDELEQYNGTTNSNGLFFFQPLVAGEYSLEAGGKEYHTNTIIITILPPRERELVLTQKEIVCPGNYFEIHATSDGVAVEGVLITNSGRSELTNASGSALFTLATGAYSFSASKAGYKNAQLSIAYRECEKPTIVENTTSQENPAQVEARDSIFTANTAIVVAQEAGKDVSKAKSQLILANDAYDANNYESAKVLAEQATTFAQNAPLKVSPAPVVISQPVTPEEPSRPFDFGVILIAGIIIVLIVAVVIFVNRKKFL